MNLKRFSQVNLARCTSSEGFGHALDSWSEAEWTNAMLGEGGEAANLTKKLLRHRDKVAGNIKELDKDIFSLKRRAAHEIADAIIYADLAIQRLGYDTSDLLRETFNAKSIELECSIVYDETTSSQPAAPVEGTWQPIATAPRDGSWILLRGESGYLNRPYRVHLGRWDAEYRPLSPWQTSEAYSFEDDGETPTHWMPAPPKEPK